MRKPRYQALDFKSYVGTSTGLSNSWFDGSLWLDYDGYPDGGDDTATMDNPNTYALIDSGDVTIGSLSVSKTATNVELEISQNRALSVTGSLTIAESPSSSGKVVLNTDSKLTVGADVTVGGSGSGTLHIDGGKMMVNGAFTIGPSSVVELAAGAMTIVQGNQLDKLHGYLAAGRILPNVGMQSYAIFDVTKDITVLRGPPPGKIRSYSCSTNGEASVVTDFSAGDVLELAKSSGGQLCTLVEVSSEAVSSGGMLQTQLRMTPLGRSYSGFDWEPYGGLHSAIQFDCSKGPCQVKLPVPGPGRTYALKPYIARTLSDNSVKARFLEKATFGPTKADINQFTSPNTWLAQQIDLPVTSHRAVFRNHMTHWHTESNYNTMLHTNACSTGARYRKYAFVSVDSERDLTIKTIPTGTNSSKVILSVDGERRTVVNGPVQCGNWRGPSRFLADGTYEICWNPIDGIYGRVMVSTSSNCDCELFFGGIYGKWD
jgi:T5SS/PEP-CTERM-associated repeat protein